MGLLAKVDSMFKGFTTVAKTVQSFKKTTRHKKRRKARKKSYKRSRRR
jgi:hypothetical protein